MQDYNLDDLKFSEPKRHEIHDGKIFNKNSRKKICTNEQELSSRFGDRRKTDW